MSTNSLLTHYFELRAIPQLEIDENDVMNQTMQSLHHLLVNQQGNIALSFPCYALHQHRSFGGIIRLLGSEMALQKIRNEISNNSTITDYMLMLPIASVPDTIKGHTRFIRVNPKGQSALRRAEKRLTAQGKWSDEVKNRMIEKWGSVHLDYPHFHLKSKSTGQSFILWIKQAHCTKSTEGKFNSYGLSQTATVPNF
ncbi:type I-F CRISPR-associated endoribonuclease Cas6/Csy4 [Orbaceae bacterium ESL0727]|nr:type I-F CRISPR-associated endoribonuclease Cas6/Csy4 [Orbaceae bacterium ESL0727]